MPLNQSEHLTYTLNEYKNTFFTKVFDHVFLNNDIKIIYDIGANVGGVILSIIKYSKKNNKTFDKIYGFEPDRDKNACKNILYIGKYYLEKQLRPIFFQRDKIKNVVKKGINLTTKSKPKNK